MKRQRRAISLTPKGCLYHVYYSLACLLLPAASHFMYFTTGFSSSEECLRGKTDTSNWIYIAEPLVEKALVAIINIVRWLFKSSICSQRKCMLSQGNFKWVIDSHMLNGEIKDMAPFINYHRDVFPHRNIIKVDRIRQRQTLCKRLCFCKGQTHSCCPLKQKKRMQKWKYQWCWLTDSCFSQLGTSSLHQCTLIFLHSYICSAIYVKCLKRVFYATDWVLS